MGLTRSTLGRWSVLSGLAKSERLVSHNFIVGAGTIAAGAFGIAFQSIASHQLQPADYGAVFAVLTLVTVIGVPAAAFTLLMARETSRGRALGHQALSAAMLRNGNRTLLAAGSVIGSGLVLSSPLLSGTFDVPIELLIVAAFGIPFGLALPLLLGEFQGEERFVSYALLASGQAGLKLAGAVVFGRLFGPVGIVAGISTATVVVYILAYAALRRKLSIRSNLEWLGPAATYASIALPSSIALGVLVSSDILLVKHYFHSSSAGQYAAVAAIGRAVFWGASGVALVLFPKVSYQRAQGRSGVQLLAASLTLVGLGGALSVGLLSVTAAGLLTIFAGPPYAQAAGYLPWYTIGMMLLGGVAVLVAMEQARGKRMFLAVLLPLAALEPILLIAFHQTLIAVVQVVDLVMGLVLLGLVATYWAQERMELARRTDSSKPIDPIGLPQLQANQ